MMNWMAAYIKNVSTGTVTDAQTLKGMENQRNQPKRADTQFSSDFSHTYILCLGVSVTLFFFVCSESSKGFLKSVPNTTSLIIPVLNRFFLGIYSCYHLNSVLNCVFKAMSSL